MPRRFAAIGSGIFVVVVEAVATFVLAKALVNEDEIPFANPATSVPSRLVVEAMADDRAVAATVVTRAVAALAARAVFPVTAAVMAVEAVDEIAATFLAT